MTEKSTVWVAYWRKKSNPQGRWAPSDNFAWADERDDLLARLRTDQNWIDWKLIPYTKATRS